MNCTICNNPVGDFKIHVKSLIGFVKPIEQNDVICCSKECAQQYYANLKASQQNGG